MRPIPTVLLYRVGSRYTRYPARNPTTRMIEPVAVVPTRDYHQLVERGAIAMSGFSPAEWSSLSCDVRERCRDRVLALCDTLGIVKPKGCPES